MTTWTSAWVLFGSVTLCWLHGILAQQCPSLCSCEPADLSGGGTVVKCIEAGLKNLPKGIGELENPAHVNLSRNMFAEIPTGIHSSVNILDLRHNLIASLKSEGYSNLYDVTELYLDYNRVVSIGVNDFITKTREDDSLPYLRKLGLSHNRIKTIEESPFRSMPSLKAVTLAYNELTEVHSDLFKGTSLLEYIDLSHNKISSVKADAFKSMPGLKYVYLSWNEISAYPAKLPMMEWLDLSHNSIQHVYEEQKEDVYPVEILNLAHNPLVCDCKTRWLKELYDRREYILKYIDIPTRDFVPTCAAPPDLAGESWDVLGDDVFRCVDEEDAPLLADDIGTLLHTDPELEKTAISTDDVSSKYEFIVNVMTSVTSIVCDSAVIKWILDDPDDLCKKIYVQYYELGSKDSTQIIAPVSVERNVYTIRHLVPETHYKACVLPATSRSEVPSSIVSPLQCVQFVTGSEEQSNAQTADDSENNNFKWRIPDSDEITAYTKLIGFSFMVSVIITGACMFIFEVISYCYGFFCGAHASKSHTD